MNHGIDICQHKLALSSATLENRDLGFERKNLSLHEEPVLPSALLPMWPKEKLLTDTVAVRHRRGVGLPWPPEAQVPVFEEPARGVGRIPLVAALTSLQAEGLEDPWNSQLDSEISWTPREKRLSETSANILTSSIADYANQVKTQSLSVVVPENFSEGTQEALLNSFQKNRIEINLIPRSVAIALEWCNENESNYQGRGNDTEEGESIGYLVTVSLAMDCWEVKLIEIRARIFQGKTWLIPIHDPAVNSSSLSFCGFSLINDMLPNEDADIWRALHTKPWLNSSIANGSDQGLYINDNLQRKLNQANLAKPICHELPCMRGMTKLQTWSGTATDVTIRFGESVTQQLHALNIEKGQILSLISCGSFAKLEYEKSKTIGSLFAKVLQTKGFLNNTITASANYAARGASRASYAIANKLPSYRAKLIPIDIFSHGRDELGDKVIKWKPLIKGETVEAGRTYEPVEPISGLAIQEGSHELELLLRRENLYRSVKAVIGEKTTKKETVEIFVSVKPGQGFSRVDVKSKNPGVFETRLDWRTMEEKDEPPPLLLEYIPKVSYIKSDWDMFYQAKQEFFYLNKKLQTERSPYLNTLRDHLNRWPKASKGDLFKHKGVLNSDGELESLSKPEIVKNFLTTLDKKFKSSKNKDLLRLGAWFYRAMPESMYEFTEKSIQSDNCSQVVLHAAGLTFHTDKQLIIFYEQFYKHCLINDVKNEWYRSFRNIVRFQNHALSDEVIETEILYVIFENILKVFSERANYSRYDKILNDCLQSSLFILKRRRYDENFLNKEHPLTSKTEELLKQTAKQHQNETYRNFAKASLDFLHKKATASSLTQVLIES